MIRFQDLTVGDVMTPEPLCLPRDASLTEVEDLLLGTKLQEAPIVDPEGRYLSSCSLADLLQARRDGTDLQTPLSALSLQAAPTCQAELRLAQACQLMIRERSHRLVVVREGRPVGVISSVEAARVLACLEDMSSSRRSSVSGQAGASSAQPTA